MKQLFVVGVLGFLAGSLMAADSGKDEIKAAAQKLAANNYSWKSTITVPEGTGGMFRPGPTEGKIAKDGTMLITMTRGDNTIEALVKGEKGALKMEEGWQSLAELTSDTGGGQPGRGTFMARMLRNLKSPAAQVDDLLAGAKELKKVEGVYASDLTDDGAKQMLTFGRRTGSQMPEPKDAKGAVKFWIKDGTLSKYEVHVQGKIVGRDDQEFEIDRTTTVEISDVGTTKFEVPEGAKAKMQ